MSISCAAPFFSAVIRPAADIELELSSASTSSRLRTTFSAVAVTARSVLEMPRNPPNSSGTCAVTSTVTVVRRLPIETDGSTPRIVEPSRSRR